MVDDVLDLKRHNGFRKYDREVADSLHYISGSLLPAARWALAHPGLAPKRGNAPARQCRAEQGLSAQCAGQDRVLQLAW